MNAYFILNPDDTDPRRLKHEREKARKLKKSHAWTNKLNTGKCAYCDAMTPPSQLTMDHIVPLARGGTTTIGNVVPSCKACNQKKKLNTPVDDLFNIP